MVISNSNASVYFLLHIRKVFIDKIKQLCTDRKCLLSQQISSNQSYRSACNDIFNLLPYFKFLTFQSKNNHF